MKEVEQNPQENTGKGTQAKNIPKTEKNTGKSLTHASKIYQRILKCLTVTSVNINQLILVRLC